MNELINNIASWLITPHSIEFSGWVWLIFGGSGILGLIVGVICTFLCVDILFPLFGIIDPSR